MGFTAAVHMVVMIMIVIMGMVVTVVMGLALVVGFSGDFPICLRGGVIFLGVFN